MISPGAGGLTWGSACYKMDSNRGGSFQQIVQNVNSQLLVCLLVSVLVEVPPQSKVHVLVPSSRGTPTDLRHYHVT